MPSWKLLSCSTSTKERNKISWARKRRLRINSRRMIKMTSLNQITPKISPPSLMLRHLNRFNQKSKSRKMLCLRGWKAWLFCSKMLYKILQLILLGRLICSRCWWCKRSGWSWRLRKLPPERSWKEVTSCVQRLETTNAEGYGFSESMSGDTIYQSQWNTMKQCPTPKPMYTW